MKELEVLLNKRWVLKSRDKEMYYKNKRCTWRTSEIYYREDGMSDH